IEGTEIVGRSAFDLYGGLTVTDELGHPIATAGELVVRALGGESTGGVIAVYNAFLQFHLSPAHDGQGRPSGVIVVANDITERKRAQLTLKKERDFSAAIIETAGALVVVLDPEGRIVRFNRACEDSSGYGFSEV